MQACLLAAALFHPVRPRVSTRSNDNKDWLLRKRTEHCYIELCIALPAISRQEAVRGKRNCRKISSVSPVIAPPTTTCTTNA